MKFSTFDDAASYMVLKNTTSIKRLRPHDTHDTITAKLGLCEVAIARESDHECELARV
jgi:hypothetical protein